MSINSSTISCDLSALNEDEQRFQARIVNRIRDEHLEIAELADGFAVRYPDGRTMIEDLARFIMLERRCCPFFTFDLRLTSEGELWLGLRGAPEVKAYLRESWPFPLSQDGAS